MRADRWYKKAAVCVIAAVLLVLFLPIPKGTCQDGGTRDYQALTYRIVVWNRLTADANDNGSAGNVSAYHKTSVFWLPDNFKSIDELWEMETGRDRAGEENVDGIRRIDMEKADSLLFVWEKEGAGSDFTIALKADGTYQYYEGFLSSHIGLGTWKDADGVLTMTEGFDLSGNERTFRFRITDEGLSFIADGSAHFMYVDVSDGDRFLRASGAEAD